MSIGAHLAAQQEGVELEHTWGIDNDKACCLTYPWNPYLGNMHELVLDWPQELTDVDILGFGFPCNDFSIVGEKRGLAGSYGPLYKTAVSVLQMFKPLAFVAENVQNIKNARNADGSPGAFEVILSELSECGYTLTPHLYCSERY
jgi:DNA (cytosine-5)-methyltransferase 1